MKHFLRTTIVVWLAMACLHLMPTFSFAQINQWTFKANFGNTAGTDRISGLAMDAAGNIYATGSYSGPMDLGTGMLPWTGNLDGFVAKFSPSGVCQWAIRFNGPGTAQDQGLGIATNGTSVFVGGVFQTSLSVNGATAITGYGGIDGFGMKLDAATGATQWVRVFGSGSTDAVQAMCIDNTGNMYVTGYFSSNTTYTSATFGTFTRSTNGVAGTDSYVGRLNGTTGNFDWVSTGGMTTYNDNVSNSGIAYVPAQNAVVMVGSTQSPGTGYTATYTNASPTPSLTLPSSGGLDVIVLELDANTGTYTNALITGGPSNSNEEALAATYDAYSKNVIFTGYYNTGALTFGSLPTIPTYGSDDLFYASYNPATNAFVWAKGAGSTIQDRGQSITSDKVGSVYITGRFRNTLNAPTSTTPLTVVSSRTNSADEIFALRINAASGNAQRLIVPVGDNTINTGDIGTGIAAGTDGSLWLGGMFGGTITFPGLGSMTTSGGTTADILLARYNGTAILPVRLLSFNAQRVNDDVALTWVTDLETDHDHFEIERSLDGRSFVVIGQQPGKLVTNQAQYIHTDADAMKQAGSKLYYRLKMVSTSGQVAYSAVVMVDAGNANYFRLNAQSNPFTGPLTLHINMPAKAIVQIRMADMNGKSIENRQVMLDKGTTLLPLTSTQTLVAGTYVITASYNDIEIAQKVIKY